MEFLVKRTVILTSRVIIRAMSLGRKYAIKIFTVLIVIYIVSSGFYLMSSVAYLGPC